MRIGRWSEFSAWIVFQVVLLAIDELAVVMSGDVGDWFVRGSRVGVSVLSTICEEFWSRSAISVPLWSSVLECHVAECALISPVIMLFVSVSRYWSVFVMSESSVA